MPSKDKPSKNKQLGRLIIFTAPSGAGKTTIVRHLLNKYDDLAFSISATTRKKREKETNGHDYYFNSIEEFKQKIANEEFVEWEEVYPDQYYGTLKSEIERLRNLGKHIVFDIDVQGAVDIKTIYQKEALAIFIMPPSREVLFDRLRNRNTEDEKSLNKRIAKAGRELAFKNRFDTILVNDKLEVALAEAEGLVEKFTGGLISG